MSERINANGGTGQFAVLEMISRRIEDDNKIKITMKMNNAETAESFKGVSFLSYYFSPNKRRIFFPKGVSAYSTAINLSVGSQRGDFNIWQLKTIENRLAASFVLTAQLRCRKLGDMMQTLIIVHRARECGLIEVK
jgi:hypothetical protein